MPQGWSFTRELTVQLLHSIYTVELKIYIYRLKWSEVIEPAIKLAKDGFSVTEHTGRDEKKKKTFKQLFIITLFCNAAWKFFLLLSCIVGHVSFQIFHSVIQL